jgi:lysophospholipase L1-like esterase
LRIGADEERWSLDAPLRRPACRTVDSDAPVAAAAIVTLDGGPVSITSFGTYRRDGGVVLSSVGVVGAQLTHFGRTDDALVRAELQAHRPGLIVLAFGTNEGFSPALTADGYESALRAQVSRLQRLAGDVPILLLGAPDAARRAPARGNDVDCGDGWSVPGLLGEVRRRQRRIAEAMNLAFWDWQAAMGGACASSRWVGSGDMRGDHVHFSRSGGDRIGAMLHQDLAEAAASYLAGPAARRR